MTSTPPPDGHHPNQGLAQVEDTGLVEGPDAGFEQETGPEGEVAPPASPTPSAPKHHHLEQYDLGQLLDGSDKGPVGGPPDSADAYGSGQDEGSID